MRVTKLPPQRCHVCFTSLDLVTGSESTGGWVFVNGGKQVERKLLDHGEEGEVTEREHVQHRTILGWDLESLWGHVNCSTRGTLRHGPSCLAGHEIDDARIAHISNLGLHRCVEQDVPRRKIAVNYGGVTAVEVPESPRHVLQDGALDVQRDVGRDLQQVVEAALKPLHHQHREVEGVAGLRLQETDTVKLDDVGVLECRE